MVKHDRGNGKLHYAYVTRNVYTTISYIILECPIVNVIFSETYHLDILKPYCIGYTLHHIRIRIYINIHMSHVWYIYITN